jgi:hypothetical protein
MITSNTESESSTISSEEETQDIGKELIVEQVQFTDDLESTNINYLNYLIIG